MRVLLALISNVILVAGCEQLDKSSSADLKASSNLTTVDQPTDSSQFTSIEWKEKNIHFGSITEGQKLEVVYTFKNTGDKPLVISKVIPGCGCTVAETPAAPIAPGKEGTIKGAFDSNGRLGTQHKSISVYANTTGVQHHELVFEVEVKPKS
ncbi:MAG: DUF1573 domain-containing protein [Chitinophagaceae bacterium]